MKKLLILLLFIPLVFNCSGGDGDSSSDYPSLTIRNNTNRVGIKAVSLNGYEFQSLCIESGGGEQTFILDGGIPSGNLQEQITITFGCWGCSGNSFTRVVTTDFFDGQTTTVRVNNHPDVANQVELTCCSCIEIE
jgi:hypothetical protein